MMSNVQLPSAEKIQLIVACVLFFLVGQFGARFYEVAGTGYYNRAQFMRLVQYVAGVAPLIILGAVMLYKQANGAEKDGGHRYVYILYGLLGVFGFLTCVMLVNDIVNHSKTSKFTAENDKSVTGAKVLAYTGLVVFALHFIVSWVLAYKNDKSNIFSSQAFMSLKPDMGSLMTKKNAAPVATTPAAPAAFGMNDLLDFGKRRRRY
jgi:Na+/melibiose symporter-like transporter